MSQNEDAIFPDFNQELAQEAQQALALRLGTMILQENTANVAAGIYSRRLEVMEGKYFKTHREVQELDAEVQAFRNKGDSVDLSKIDIETLRTELAHRGFELHARVVQPA